METLDQIKVRMGWRYWVSWLSPILPVWLWHTFFDGTRLCRCDHSAEYRRIRLWTWNGGLAPGVRPGIASMSRSGAARCSSGTASLVRSVRF